MRIVNCARGGLVDEEALRAALDSGQVSGAAFDVFTEEPAKDNPLFGHPHVVCTPHLGAATTEAQENVALQIAEQMSDYLLQGAISNAVNFPSITAEEAPKLRPFIALAERLGSFAGQLTESGLKVRQDHLSGRGRAYEGEGADQRRRRRHPAAHAGRHQRRLGAEHRQGARHRHRGDDAGGGGRLRTSLITVGVVTERQERSLSGTVFADGKPRVVNIKGINVDAEFAPSMLYISNEDKPGFIGRFATTLGDAGVNIATFALGRDKPGGSAVALVEVDGAVPGEVLSKIQTIPGVKQAKPLAF